MFIKPIHQFAESLALFCVETIQQLFFHCISHGHDFIVNRLACLGELQHGASFVDRIKFPVNQVAFEKLANGAAQNRFFDLGFIGHLVSYDSCLFCDY